MIKKIKFKAYIPLQRKTWTIPPTRNFALGIPTCWYLETLKFALPPMRMLKFVLPPTLNPNAGRWNIGWVGSPGVAAHVGHVHFMLFVSISFALGSQRERSFQWNMGLTEQLFNSERHSFSVYFNYQISLFVLYQNV